MTDRELLKLAAKAIGKENWQSQTFYDDDRCDSEGVPYWNPLREDDDAFQLLVEIGNRHNATLEIGCGGADCDVARREVYGFQGRDDTHDLNSATRRAIVKAAAELGKEAHE